MSAPPSSSGAVDFERLWMHLPVPAFLAVEERIVAVNEAAVSLVGAPREKVLGAGVFDFVEPSYRDLTTERYWLRHGGENPPSVYEVMLRHGTGRPVRVRLHIAALGHREQLVLLQDVSAAVQGGALTAALARLAYQVQRARTTGEVLAAAGDGLRELGIWFSVTRLEGEHLALEYQNLPPDLAARLTALLGRPLEGIRLSATVFGPTREVLTTRTARYVDDLRPAVFELASKGNPPPTPEALRGIGRQLLSLRGMLCPLQLHEQVWGMAALCSPSLDERDGATLSLFANQIASALEVVTSMERLTRRNQELAAIQALSSVGGNSLEETAPELLRITAQAAGSKTVALYLLEGDHLVLTGSWGVSGPTLPRKYARLPVNSSLTWRMVREGRAGALKLEELPEVYQEEVKAHGGDAVAYVPLLLKGKPIGAVTLILDGRSGPIEEVLRSAESLTAQTAIHVENHRLYAESQRLFRDLRQSYDDLARAQQELVKSERLAALGELAAVMAHEVRNPLGVIFNSLVSLRRLLKPEGDPAALLDIVGEEADRLNGIVGELLDFARPNKAVVRPEPVDEVINSAVEATNAAAAGHQVTITAELSGALSAPMDAQMIRRCLINLLTNAVQALPRGGRIVVRAHPEVHEGRATLRIDVADDGPGIPAELRERIFQPFFTTKAAGTGLGLAIVKRIIEAHRGEVVVGHGQNGGALFTFRLPLGVQP